MTPGFHPNMSRAEYDAAPGIRNTELGWAARSLAHYKLYKTNPPEETEAKRDGQLLHLAVLEPEKFDKTVVIIPEDAPKKPQKRHVEAKKPSKETLEADAWWTDFGKRYAGKTFISADESRLIARIADAVLSDKEAGEIIRQCTRREVAVFSRHEGTGLLCKSLFDLPTDDDSFIWDLKFVIDAEPEAYRRAIFNYGYHRQSGHYTDHNQRLGKPRPLFGHIVVEKEEPYIVSVRPFDEDTIEIGRLEVNALMHRIARAQKTGVYPGYHTGQEDTGLPLWKLKEFAR